MEFLLQQQVGYHTLMPTLKFIGKEKIVLEKCHLQENLHMNSGSSYSIKKNS